MGKYYVLSYLFDYIYFGSAIVKPGIESVSGNRIQKISLV